MIAPYTTVSNGTTPMATGSICVLGTDGRVIPLVPQQASAGVAAPMSVSGWPLTTFSSGSIGPFSQAAAPAQNGTYPMATGSICILSNGQVATVAPASFGPFSNGPATPMATGSVCFFNNEGKFVPLHMCGG